MSMMRVQIELLKGMIWGKSLDGKKYVVRKGNGNDCRNGQWGLHKNRVGNREMVYGNRFPLNGEKPIDFTA